MDHCVPGPVACSRNIAAAARLLRAAREDVASALFVVGFATCVMAVRAAAGSPAARRALAVWAVFGGMGAMWAALWVAADAPRRRTAGRVILCAAFLPLVVAVGLSSADPGLVFNIIDAMA